MQAFSAVNFHMYIIYLILICTKTVRRGKSKMHIYYQYQIQFKSNFLSISMGSYFIIDVKHPTVEIQRLFYITPTGFLF